MTLRGRVVYTLAFLGMASCARPAATERAAPAAGPPRSAITTLVAVAELHGTTEPCGCNSDPLGDLARLVALAQGGLLLDAGNNLYDTGGAAQGRRAQADRKAEVIGSVYAKAGAEVALGPNDLFGGSELLKPARQACNVSSSSGLTAPHVREVNGIRVGILGVTDASLAAPAKSDWKLAVAPGAEAAKAALAKLASEKPDVIVALLAMRRADARKLLQAVPGIDFAIVGLEVEDGMIEPEPVGEAWLVAPADQGRRAAKLELSRGDAPAGTRLKLARFDGEAGRARAIERFDRRQKALEEQLTKFAADKTADPGFVAARKLELSELVAERARAVSEKATPPKTPYFSYTLVPIRQLLPRDPAVAVILQKLAHDNGLANLAAAQKEQPPAAETDRPSYVGSAACARCHKPAVAFWEKTHHAQAWKTLVTADKQYDYDCIGCHVTGWMSPGGSHLASVEKLGLVNVQCEVCHGPGSKHVAEDGLDDPLTIRRAPPRELCANKCHTKEHSDTFAETPYLRDILGPGHGEARRKALGEGPTGHSLREAALAAAKR